MNGLVVQIMDVTASPLTAVLFSLRKKGSLGGLRACRCGRLLTREHLAADGRGRTTSNDSLTIFKWAREWRRWDAR